MTMIKKTDISKIVLSAGIILLTACVEPFEPETINFESALVVEATITDQVKEQEIFLSRTFEFEADGPELEENAVVQVLDDQGNSFEFRESSPGVYRSTAAFAALSGRTYSLAVTTSDGRTYTSDADPIPIEVPIERVYAERFVNSDGVDGIGIFVDSFDPTGNAKNYRYNYEETFMVIAPFWTPNDLIGDPDGGCNVIEVARERDERICYRTQNSTDIIQISTNNFNEDRVSKFLVRFISSQDYIISHRYSILVKQLIQSESSFTYYQTLNDFSSSESLFSDTQVGFLNGNIVSEIDESEKVLGYFDVASVNEQRIFFDYDDFYPGEPLPPYINPCSVNAPVLARGIPPECILRSLVERNAVRLVDENSTPQAGEGPYLVVPRVCGDCTALGSTEVPGFWVE